MSQIQDTDSVIIDNRVYQISELSNELKKILIEKLSESSESYTKPELSQIYNISEFGKIAEKILSKPTFAYYRTGAADEITLLENEKAFQRIYFKPRVLQSVSTVSLKTTILGSKTDLPFYITAFAGASRDNNTAGEKPLSSAAGKTNVIQMIPSMTEFKLKDLVDAHDNDNVDQWLQLYVREGFEKVSKLIKDAEETGNITALFFTVDLAQLGRRESEAKVISKSGFQKPSPVESDLNWDDLKRLREQTKLKVILKGVQSLEDALKAVELGFEGFVISNHGGRQLDTARSSIEILAEIVPVLKKKNLFHKVEILIDGGVRRGSDVVKAFALGAKGVGLGRPFLYSLHTHGEAGVLKVIELLKEEIELTLRLLGVRNIEEVDESYVDILDLFGNRAIKL